MENAQVVIQTAFLGDLILSIPFLLRVKKNAPHEKLILICKKGLGLFLKQQGVVDEFVEIAKGDRQSYAKARETLSRWTVTNLYTVHRSPRSLIFSWQLKAQKKVGFKSAFSFVVFDESFKYEKSWPDAIRKFKLLSLRDAEVAQALAHGDFAKLNTADAAGVLPPVPGIFAFNSIEKRKTSGPKTVALFPGSVWTTKRWTEEGFTAVAQALVKKGHQVLLLGGPDEKSLCDAIAQKVPQAKVLAGPSSIQESIEKVGACDLVIANDSAATHMAAFKNTPSITMFGPTTLDLGFRPWSDQSRVVQIDLDCRPCGAHGHMQCPLGHHHCMKWIKPSAVIEKAMDFLES